MPLVRKSWEGHAAETQSFQERAAALRQTFQRSPTPCERVADATLSNEAQAPTLSPLGVSTRMPGTRTLVSPVSRPALTGDMGQRLDDTTRYGALELCHYGMAPRGLVVSSQAALERAHTRVDNAGQRDSATIHKHLLHLPATRFATPAAAPSALATLATSWREHQVATASVIEHKRSACQGRPAPTPPLQALAWQLAAPSRPAQERMRARTQQGAGFIRGTPLASRQGSAPEVLPAYTAQSRAEGGFRFLQDPRVFVSALCVKKPCRIQGLRMVLTCALLVYAVTQRRWRQPFALQNETIPNPINQPTQRPTLRWVFQLLEGMHRVRVTVPSEVHDLIEGLHEVQIKILRLFGQEVCRLYQISPG